MRRQRPGFGGQYYVPPGTFQTTAPRRRRRGPASGGAVAAAGPTPPPGSYDPGLEAQRGQSQLSVQDLQMDTRRANRLGTRDLALNTRLAELGARRSLHDTRLDRSRGMYDISTRLARGEQDIGTQRASVESTFARDMTDLAQANSRGGEDYTRALAGLGRKYSVMGGQQAEAAAAGGVSATRGGFAAQSAEKRAANQSIEQAPIDTSRQRQQQDILTKGMRLGVDRGLSLQDLLTSEGRLQSDSALSSTRLGQDASTQIGRTKQNLRTDERGLTRTEARAARGRATDLSRALRDQAIFEQQLTSQEYFAANQTNPRIKFPTLADIQSGNYTTRGRHRRGGH